MPKFASEDLKAFATEIFRACGSPDDIAEEVAEALILADLSGHPSHGIIRVPSYFDMMQGGRILPANRPTVVRRTDNAALVDGDWGFGYPAAAFATRLVCEMAKERQVALAGMVHMNHVGRLGQWAELASDLGIILIMAVGGSSTYPIAAPYGGVGKVLSTNPIAAGVPSASRGPFIMDFATTAVAEGKLKVARAKGAPVPPNTIIDKHGNPTTDPEDFYDGGMLLPFGGHKGYALAILAEALGGYVTGAYQTDNPNKFGALLIGINPAVFEPFAKVGAAVDELFQRITSVPPAPGFDRVMIPGEPERRARELFTKEGVELAGVTVKALQDVAAKVNVDASVLERGRPDRAQAAAKG